MLTSADLYPVQGGQDVEEAVVSHLVTLPRLEEAEEPKPVVQRHHDHLTQPLLSTLYYIDIKYVMPHLAVAGQHRAVVGVARVPLVRLTVDEHLQTGSWSLLYTY